MSGSSNLDSFRDGWGLELFNNPRICVRVYIYAHLYMYINEYVWACIYSPETSTKRKDVTQSTGVHLVWAKKRFLLQEPILSNYLAIAEEKIDGFKPFLKALVSDEMQTVSSSIWTRGTELICCDDNRYTTSAS